MTVNIQTSQYCFKLLSFAVIRTMLCGKYYYLHKLE